MPLLTLQQTDTATSFPVPASGSPIGVNPMDRMMVAGGIPGVTEVVSEFQSGKGIRKRCLGFFHTPVGSPGVAVWPAGEYVVPVNVTAIPPGTFLDEVRVLRLAPDGSLLGVVGSVSGLSGGAGVCTVVVAGVESSGDVADLLGVGVIFRTAGAGARSVGVTPSDVITTPIPV